MAQAQLRTRTFSKRASRFAHFAVDVDALSVLEVIDSVEEAVSPMALMYFLAGPVSAYFEDQIVDTFASLGGGGAPGGSWAPLEESTLKIRHALGYWDDYAINERSGELLDFLIHSREYNHEAMGASMEIGKTGDPVILKKMTVAQKGYTQGSTDMLPGAYTPPRPVLGLTGEDTAALHVMLQVHIANWVANGFAAAGSLSP